MRHESLEVKMLSVDFDLPDVFSEFLIWFELQLLRSMHLYSKVGG